MHFYTRNESSPKQILDVDTTSWLGVILFSQGYPMLHPLKKGEANL